jgi:hypothetical protein
MLCRLNDPQILIDTLVDPGLPATLLLAQNAILLAAQHTARLFKLLFDMISLINLLRQTSFNGPTSSGGCETSTAQTSSSSTML